MQPAGVALNFIFRSPVSQRSTNNVECGSSKVAKDMEFHLVGALCKETDLQTVGSGFATFLERIPQNNLRKKEDKYFYSLQPFS